MPRRLVAARVSPASDDGHGRAVRSSRGGPRWGMRGSGLARVLTLLFALLHLGAPPFASLADARIERELAADPAGVPHVESEGGSSACPRAHPPDCALCHIVVSLAEPGARPHAANDAATTSASSGRAVHGVHAAGPLTLVRPRAPPAA